ncbi:MAG: hypothetical protein M0Z78_00055, partial [Betaproteobacteria bacterium]|nr:hypothetical protein [Betaproteobacteria bacterium]
MGLPRLYSWRLINREADLKRCAEIGDVQILELELLLLEFRVIALEAGEENVGHLVQGGIGLTV